MSVEERLRDALAEVEALRAQLSRATTVRTEKEKEKDEEKKRL